MDKSGGESGNDEMSDDVLNMVVELATATATSSSEASEKAFYPWNLRTDHKDLQFDGSWQAELALIVNSIGQGTREPDAWLLISGSKIVEGPCCEIVSKLSRLRAVH